MDAFRAAQPTYAATHATALGAVKDDAVFAQAKHLSCLLVQDALNTSENPHSAAAIRLHLDIEGKAAIADTIIECSQDFSLRADLYQLARLQIETFGRQLPLGCTEQPGTAQLLKFEVRLDIDGK